MFAPFAHRWCLAGSDQLNRLGPAWYGYIYIYIYIYISISSLEPWEMSHEPWEATSHEPLSREKPWSTNLEKPWATNLGKPRATSHELWVLSRESWEMSHEPCSIICYIHNSSLGPRRWRLRQRAAKTHVNIWLMDILFNKQDTQCGVFCFNAPVPDFSLCQALLWQHIRRRSQHSRISTRAESSQDFLADHDHTHL